MAIGALGVVFDLCPHSLIGALETTPLCVIILSGAHAVTCLPPRVAFGDLPLVTVSNWLFVPHCICLSVFICMCCMSTIVNIEVPVVKRKGEFVCCQRRGELVKIMLSAEYFTGLTHETKQPPGYLEAAAFRFQVNFPLTHTHTHIHTGDAVDRDLLTVAEDGATHHGDTDTDPPLTHPTDGTPTGEYTLRPYVS